MFYDYNRYYGLNAKVVRIFNTYGPNMHPEDGRVVSNFIMQALQGEDITIYGKGTQTRSFCYVDDLVIGLITVMETDVDNFGPVNLGNPSEITILEFAKVVIELTQSTSELIFKVLPLDDPKRRCPDIGTAHLLYSWEPHISLHDGLLKTIDYFRSLQSKISN